MHKPWMFPVVAALLAAGAWALWGWNAWTAILAVLMLGCWIIFVYGWLLATRALAVLDEAPVTTRGMTMNWAAPVYDWYCPKLGLGKAFRNATLRYATLQPGERVLEVGCGTGVLTRLAAQAVGTSGHAAGIDPSYAMLLVARQTAVREASRAEFKVAAIERLPFEPRTFDVVLSSLMLHHLPPDVKRIGLHEVYHVLKPGGRLLVVDVDRPSNILGWLILWPWLFVSMTAPNLRGEIPNYLNAAGFDSVQLHGRWYGVLTFWTARKPGVTFVNNDTSN